ncbi:MAG: OsmC family protein [Oceanococcus sp.]
MEARVRWLDNASFVAETGSGHAIVIDGPPSIGGRNIGPRPMELMLLGVGSCSSVDVLHILKRARQNVVDCDCRVSAQRAETDPKVFTSIHLHFTVSGHELKPAQVERAVKLSAEKYCSASLMLQATVEITHACELVELGPAD